jgi:hypothetical protein
MVRHRVKTFDQMEVGFHPSHNVSKDQLRGGLGQTESTTPSTGGLDESLLPELMYDFHQVVFRDIIGRRHLGNGH